MPANTSETTLLRLFELLDRWSAVRRPDDLYAVLAAVQAADHRGERETTELMCSAIGAVTSVHVTDATTDAWATHRFH